MLPEHLASKAYVDANTGGLGSGVVAPAVASYVVLAPDGTLTNERILTGTADKISITDGGAGNPVTLSLPDNLSIVGLITQRPTCDESTLPTTLDNHVASKAYVDSVAAGGGSGGAPSNASYVVIGLDPTLTNERVLTGTADKVSITDGGAGNPVTLSLPDNLSIVGLIAQRPLCDESTLPTSLPNHVASKAYVDSVAAGGGSGGAPSNASYVVIGLDPTLTNERVLTGVANKVSITDGGAGSPVSLSLPDNLSVVSLVTQRPTCDEVALPTTLDNHVASKAYVDSIAGTSSTVGTAKILLLEEAPTVPNGRIITAAPYQTTLTQQLPLGGGSPTLTVGLTPSIRIGTNTNTGTDANSICAGSGGNIHSLTDTLAIGMGQVLGTVSNSLVTGYHDINVASGTTALGSGSASNKVVITDSTDSVFIGHDVGSARQSWNDGSPTSTNQTILIGVDHGLSDPPDGSVVISGGKAAVNDLNCPHRPIANGMLGGVLPPWGAVTRNGFVGGDQGLYLLGRPYLAITSENTRFYGRPLCSEDYPVTEYDHLVHKGYVDSLIPSIPTRRGAWARYTPPPSGPPVQTISASRPNNYGYISPSYFRVPGKTVGWDANSNAITYSIGNPSDTFHIMVQTNFSIHASKSDVQTRVYLQLLNSSNNSIVLEISKSVMVTDYNGNILQETPRAFVLTLDDYLLNVAAGTSYFTRIAVIPENSSDGTVIYSSQVGSAVVRVDQF